MPAPDRQPLSLPLLEVAAADDGPAPVAGEHAPERFDLVVDLPEAKQTGDRAKRGDLRREQRRVPVLAIERDVPAAREHQPRSGVRAVEHRLGGARGVVPHAPRGEHDQYAVATGDGTRDDLEVVGHSGNNFDATLNASSFATLCS